MDIQIPICLGMKKEDFPKSGYMFELKCIYGLNLALTTLYYFNIRPRSSFLPSNTFYLVLIF